MTEINCLFMTLLALIILSNYVSCTQLSILVEDTTEDTNFETDCIELLDGKNCDEFTGHGSVLLSGVEYIFNIFNEEKFSNNQLLFGLVCGKCMRECTIIKDLLQSLTSDKNRKKTIPIMVFLPETSSQIMDVSVFHMSSPAIDLVDAFFALCQSLEWKRVGVITDSGSHQTTMLSNYLQYPSQERNTSLSVFLDLTELQMKGSGHIHYILNELKESGTKIVLLTAYPSQISDILCTAYQSNMVWPQYAWVIYVLQLLRPGIKFTCEHDDFLEGVIFLTQDFTLPLDLPIQSDSSPYHQQNNLIRDAIALLKKAGNMSHDIISALRGINYSGLTGNITFDSSQHITRDIVFLQVKDGGLICRAKLRNGSIEQNKWLLPHEQFPTSDLPVRVSTIYPLWLSIVEVIVYTIAITAVFVLFIYFRNEPEIKATSWLLSLLMILSSTCWWLTC